MNHELDPRPYDVIWDSDGRRQAAQRGANTRFPDHHAGYDDFKPLSKRDVALAALIPLGLAALFFAPWVIRTLLHLAAQ